MSVITPFWYLFDGGYGGFLCSCHGRMLVFQGSFRLREGHEVDFVLAHV